MPFRLQGRGKAMCLATSRAAAGWQGGGRLGLWTGEKDETPR